MSCVVSRSSPAPIGSTSSRSLEALGPQELFRREQEVRRLLRENGVTYNVYSDARGEGRPWALDLLPTLLTSQEWRDIERGLIQRAELFNLILAELVRTTAAHKKRAPAAPFDL